MEQRIGSSSQPLEGAGFDPAFIPGLTSPVSGEPEDAKPKKAVKGQAEAEADAEAPVEDEAPEEPSAEAEKAEEAEEAEDADDASAEAEEAEESEGTDEEAEEEEAPDGPVFEASDRRAKIVADHKGVRLSLDDQHCEFRWDEIGALETETPRFGKRFTVTVHTPDNRWYPIEIEAKSRSVFQEWETQLDEVLDAYFDENAADDAP
ncbi:hypothetical protein [Streptomyces spongiae]|uniref:Uncharacterized protein n=1 Tax=Streptomyces spongiae TaxID=565072 RepID=A0A5N8XUN2_9ACTN|nr:hypothetical protein [Streptomyces spongiae]MPY63101.1 hypothetical protein [Streptomyces spongiae]